MSDIKKKKRVDMYSKPIAKGSRMHKICFRDVVQNKSINDVFIVDSYK